MRNYHRLKRWLQTGRISVELTLISWKQLLLRRSKLYLFDCCVRHTRNIVHAFAIVISWLSRKFRSSCSVIGFQHQDSSGAYLLFVFLSFLFFGFIAIFGFKWIIVECAVEKVLISVTFESAHFTSSDFNKWSNKLFFRLKSWNFVNAEKIKIS